MLKLEDVTNSIKETIQVDDYIPLSVRWINSNLDSPRLFWRTGNFKTSLLEIGIDSKTGIIRSITLTFTERISVCEAEVTDSPSVEGTPVFQIADWGSEFYLDVSQDFDTYLSGQNLNIVLGGNKSVGKIVRSGRVTFFFDSQNVLKQLEILQLTEEEFMQLSNHFKNNC